MGTRTGASQAVVETLGREPTRILRISGELTLPDTPRILAELTVALHTALCNTVIVELSDMVVRSAPLLMVFPTALRHVGGWPLAALHLAAPSPAVRSMVKAVRMYHYVPVHDSLTAAILAARADVTSQRFVLRLERESDSVELVREAARAMWPHLQGPELVANELASNAIAHTEDAFLLSLATRGDSALVAVADFSSQPVIRPSRLDVARTRSGLQLVASLSQDWGVRQLAPQGKTVWAQVVA